MTVVPCLRPHGFDAAIWTALPPSFQKETGESFSLDTATAYIQRLPDSARRVAVAYFEKAPPEVNTPLRQHLADKGIIKSHEKWGVV